MGTPTCGGIITNLRVGRVGLRAQVEHSATWGLRELWRQTQGEAGLSEGKEDEEGPFGMSVCSLKYTEKLKPKATGIHPIKLSVKCPD